MVNDRCLILFVKYPEKGKVKSRLARNWTDESAADLYRNFVLDIIATLKTGYFNFKIYFYPPEKAKEIKNIFGESHQYEPQSGTDLGSRMKNAFVREFKAGFKSVVLIGSDCPDLPAEIIEESFNVLENNSGTAIGPSPDGGYYLIGFCKDAFCPDIFSDLEWGNSSVLEKTKDILRSNGLLFNLMPQWRDIDQKDDLNDLIKRSLNTPFTDSKTMQFLKNHNLVKG